MVDPVVLADGRSYERTAIEAWLASGAKSSPVTNERLIHLRILPNHALQQVIVELLPRLPADQRVEFEQRKQEMREELEQQKQAEKRLHELHESDTTLGMSTHSGSPVLGLARAAAATVRSVTDLDGTWTQGGSGEILQVQGGSVIDRFGVVGQIFVDAAGRWQLDSWVLDEASSHQYRLRWCHGDGEQHWERQEEGLMWFQVRDHFEALVRSDMDANAPALASHQPGQRLRGKRQGVWVILCDEPGFVLYEELQLEQQRPICSMICLLCSALILLGIIGLVVARARAHRYHSSAYFCGDASCGQSVSELFLRRDIFRVFLK